MRLAVLLTFCFAFLPISCSAQENMSDKIQRMSLTNDYQKGTFLEEQARIDTLMTVMSNYPNSPITFYLNFTSIPTIKQVSSRILRVLSHFAHRGVSSKNKLTFVITTSEFETTRFEIGEKGQEKTECNDCRILRVIKGTDFKLKKTAKGNWFLLDKKRFFNRVS